MPYNPGISHDNSGLVRGLMHGSASIAAGLEKYQEQKKALVQNSKFAEGLFKTNPELQKRIGMSEDEFKLLAGLDKIALTSGAIASIHNEVEQMKVKESAQAIETAKQHQRYYQQQDTANRAVGRFVSDFAQGPQQFNLENSAPGNQADILQLYAPAPPETRIIEALKHNQEAGASQHFPETVNALQRFMTPNKVKMNPALGQNLPVPGGHVIGMGPENAPHFAADPRPVKEAVVHKTYPWLTSTNEAEVKKGLDAIKDPDEFIQAVKDRAAVMNSRESDPFGYKAIMRETMDKALNERIKKTPSLFERWFGGGNKPATPAAAPAAATPQYKKGQRVKQNGATFEWDGKTFVPVKTQ